MKLSVNSQHSILTILLLFLTAASLQAQKLPWIQQESLIAPLNIAVDGKSTEWNNTFQAYNNKTEVFYSVSNDSGNLYVVIQATNPEIIKKIIVGGITFSFSESNEIQKYTAITFPVYDKSYPALYLSLSEPALSKKDTLRNRMLSDSIMKAHNHKIQSRLKLIEVVGIKEIKDSVLSVYNEEGIKVAALFDNKRALIYEFGIPLEFLGFDRNSRQEVYYNIKLNGIYRDKYRNDPNIQLIPTARGEVLMSVGSDGRNTNIGIITPQNRAMGYPTDFSGKYTLATK